MKLTCLALAACVALAAAAQAPAPGVEAQALVRLSACSKLTLLERRELTSHSNCVPVSAISNASWASVQLKAPCCSSTCGVRGGTAYRCAECHCAL